MYKTDSEFQTPNIGLEKVLYIIAGCNGAGKTTASYTILPEILDCKEFINADEIAKGISPFNSSAVSVVAGKIMLKRIDELFQKNISFSIETTLASKVFIKTIKKAKEMGYLTVLIFFWLSDVEIAKKRVEQRVKSGGHNIEINVIERRYKSGILNLFNLYLPIVDTCCIYDNTTLLDPIAEKYIDFDKINIIDSKKYERLREYYESNK